MHWVVERWPDLAIAVVLAVIFAAVFAVIADAMSVGSRVREYFRRVQNKRSEKSAARLRTRIGELEHRRRMLASRTAILLLGLQATLRTLGFISGGLFLSVLRTVDIPTLLQQGLIELAKVIRPDAHVVIPPARPLISGALSAELFFLSITLFFLAASSAKAGLQLAQVDRGERLAEAIQQLDNEIGGLKSKEVELLQRNERTTSSRRNII